MASLFAGAADDPPQGVGDSHGGSSSRNRGGGFVTEQHTTAAGAVIIPAHTAHASKWKKPWDAMNARRRWIPAGGTANFIDDDNRASVTVGALVEHMYGAALLDEQKDAVWRGVIYAYVLNSSSQSQQDRGYVKVSGMQDYPYLGVVTFLGSGARRFFRSHAAGIAQEIRDLWDPPSGRSLTDMELETKEKIAIVARERGLGRVPWYAFDTADAIPVGAIAPQDWNLVLASKSRVLPTRNVVDEVVVSSDSIERSMNDRVATTSAAASNPGSNTARGFVV